MEVVAQTLLNPNTREIDVLLLDSVVAAAYNPVSPHRSDVNKTLQGVNFGKQPVLNQRGCRICRVDSLSCKL
eukprot:11272454-Ditylum_brightwellii.AAC.1